MVTEPGLPVSESSTKILKFSPTDSEHKLHKTIMKNWDRLYWEHVAITTTLCSAANGKELYIPNH